MAHHERSGFPDAARRRVTQLHRESIAPGVFADEFLLLRARAYRVHRTWSVCRRIPAGERRRIQVGGLTHKPASAAIRRKILHIRRMAEKNLQGSRNLRMRTLYCISLVIRLYLLLFYIEYLFITLYIILYYTVYYTV